jgi:hypothetical protein
MTAPDDRQLRALYKPDAKTPVLIDVPPMRFLQIDGAGGIGGAVFAQSVGALYGLAYPVKFAAKKRLGVSYNMPPLEAIYWRADDAREFSPDERDSLLWRQMIMVPDDVSGEFIDEVRDMVATKKNPPRLADVRLQTFSEGRSVQMLHLGPYSEEPATIDRLVAFAEDGGYEVVGDHHEIYHGDPNRSDPAKLKTVVRYGVRKAKRG